MRNQKIITAGLFLLGLCTSDMAAAAKAHTQVRKLATTISLPTNTVFHYDKNTKVCFVKLFPDEALGGTLQVGKLFLATPMTDQQEKEVLQLQRAVHIKRWLTAAIAAGTILGSLVLKHQSQSSASKALLGVDGVASVIALCYALAAKNKLDAQVELMECVGNGADRTYVYGPTKADRIYPAHDLKWLINRRLIQGSVTTIDGVRAVIEEVALNTSVLTNEKVEAWQKEYAAAYGERAKAVAAQKAAMEQQALLARQAAQARAEKQKKENEHA